MSSSEGTSVTEGKATIYFPSEKGVFYNPPQIPNRDLSVLALRQFAQDWQREAAEKIAKQRERAAARAAKAAEAAEATSEGAGSGDGVPAASGNSASADTATAGAEGGGPSDAQPSASDKIRVLDVMTASGLRALRYTLEVAEVGGVVANDLDPQAVAALRENMRRNGLDEDRIQPSTGDGVAVMQRSKPPEGTRFEAVELDPYGSAAPFLDAAMQSVAEGGLLMVTCTDLAVLCATYPEACHAKCASAARAALRHLRALRRLRAPRPTSKPPLWLWYRHHVSGMAPIL